MSLDTKFEKQHAKNVHCTDFYIVLTRTVQMPQKKDVINRSKSQNTKFENKY